MVQGCSIPTARPPPPLQNVPFFALVLIVACLLAKDLIFLFVVTAVPSAQLQRERILISVGVHWTDSHCFMPYAPVALCLPTYFWCSVWQLLAVL